MHFCLIHKKRALSLKIKRVITADIVDIDYLDEVASIPTKPIFR